MKFWQRLLMLFPSALNRTEVSGAPPSLKDFEKLHIQRIQDEMKRTLQILELEAEVMTDKR